MPKKRWSDLTPQQKSGVLAMIAVQAVLAAFAQRDLSSRSADQVRGPKMLWRVLVLNSVGAIAYVAFGRRSSTS